VRNRFSLNGRKVAFTKSIMLLLVRVLRSAVSLVSFGIIEGMVQVQGAVIAFISHKWSDRALAVVARSTPLRTSAFFLSLGLLTAINLL
jgi:hypothetical protein